MKLRVLVLDDEPHRVNKPLLDALRPFLGDRGWPELKSGGMTDVKLDRFVGNSVEIEIVCCDSGVVNEVAEAIKNRTYRDMYDLVLLDEDWGPGANQGGSHTLLPLVYKNVVGVTSELPVIVLFTQHWADSLKVNEFLDLLLEKQYFGSTKLAGFGKNDTAALRLLIQRLVAQRILEERHSQEMTQVAKQASASGMVGRSAGMANVHCLVSRVCSKTFPVLIRGESGTGKEMVARDIHQNSDRANRAFLSINISALPHSLVESELFGSMKGAFTGANTKKGLFENADGGTLFLDEIGEASQATQVKLLRAIQEGEFMRVGGSSPIVVDVRIIAATNRDLERDVRLGRFREDLYYRLNVVPIILPTLYERREDIPLLVQHFVKRYSDGKVGIVISDKALECLNMYSWPGNIRELENAIQHALAMSDGNIISANHLPAVVRYANTVTEAPPTSGLLMPPRNRRGRSLSRTPSRAEPIGRVPREVLMPGTLARRSPAKSLVIFLKNNKLCKITKESALQLEELLDGTSGQDRAERNLKDEKDQAFEVYVQLATYDPSEDSWSYAPQRGESIRVTGVQTRKDKNTGEATSTRIYGTYNWKKVWDEIEENLTEKHRLELKELPLAVGLHLLKSAERELSKTQVTAILFDPICERHLNSLRIRLFDKVQVRIENICGKYENKDAAIKALLRLHELE